MAINLIRINPVAVVRTLGAVAFLLVLASIAGQLTKYMLGYDYVFGLVPLLYVDSERNIPALFSVLLLFCAASLVTVIAVLKKQEMDPDVSRWTILAFGFLFMVIDEASSLHEKLAPPIRGLIGEGPFGFFYFAWVIPGFAVVFVLVLFFLKFLLRLPTNTRFYFVVAAAVYIGGAIGIELVGGRYDEMHGQNNLTYSMIATLEESLEMAGIIVFIYALLKYLADTYVEVRFRADNFEGNSQSKAITNQTPLVR